MLKKILITIREISIKTGLSETQVSATILKYNMQEYIQYVRSNLENEVVTFLYSIKPDLNIQRNYRGAISPKEIDIFLPEYNLGIEVNPTSSHNSSVPFIDDNDILPPSYHRRKSDLCSEKDIFLFHLFGYEWNHRNEVIKSILSNLIGVYQRKIYARKCIVKEVTSSECIQFMNKNHRQSYAASSIRLGLYFNSELVSLMTFVNNKDGSYELNRFCSKLGYQVVGGASKLFKHFLRTVECEKVVSYSDFARSRGSLYETLGFHFVSLSDPSYVWVDVKSDMYYHRSNCQKSNLKKLLGDDSIDIEHETERSIMLNHGYVQVYDSGVKRWEYTM